jgi:hypothetical protein
MAQSYAVRGSRLVCMTEGPDHVLISYATFVECQQRRQRIAGELAPPKPPTIDTHMPPVPNHPPAPLSTAARQS